MKYHSINDGRCKRQVVAWAGNTNIVCGTVRHLWKSSDTYNAIARVGKNMDVKTTGRQKMDAKHLDIKKSDSMNIGAHEYDIEKMDTISIGTDIEKSDTESLDIVSMDIENSGDECTCTCQCHLVSWRVEFEFWRVTLDEFHMWFRNHTKGKSAQPLRVVWMVRYSNPLLGNH